MSMSILSNTVTTSITRWLLPAIWTTGSAQQRTLMLGVSFAILSNILFGVLYAYSSFLTPLSGTQVFIWRMLAMWVVLIGYLLMSGRLTMHIDKLRALRTVKQWAWLLLPTPIFLSQLWLFMWAPVNGQGVQAAMGYFLFPLMMVVAVAVHGFGGVWGTLAAGLFYTGDLFNLSRVAVQALGVGAGLGWGLGLGLVMYKLIDVSFGLKASRLHEQRGLDYTEHAELGYPEFQKQLFDAKNLTERHL